MLCDASIRYESRNRNLGLCLSLFSDNILSAHDLSGCLERDCAVSEPSEAENVTNAIGYSKKSAELVYCD